MSKIFVDLAIPTGIDRLFTYTVPPELQDRIKPGVRVAAPFGKKTIIGFVVNISKTTELVKLKNIIDVLDDETFISEEMLKLTKWISEYYFAPWGEVLRAAVPQNTASGSVRTVFLKVGSDEAIKATSNAPTQKKVINILLEHDELRVSQIQKQLRVKNIYSVLKELESKGLILITEIIKSKKLKPKFEKVIFIDEYTKPQLIQWLDLYSDKNNKKLTKQINIINFLYSLPVGSNISVNRLLKESSGSLSALKTLVRTGVFSISEREVLRQVNYSYQVGMLKNFEYTNGQQSAIDEIRKAQDENKFHSFLLHGITGSGKTQIYIESIQHALVKGKTAIVLVPEISLTPQIVSRFRQYFHDKVAVFHSRMSIGERQDAWRLTREGKYSIVIGPRSAIFAPLKNIGLIVVDEEHESSYKQFDQIPRYNARDVAVVRGHNTDAVVILGSATPSIDSYYNALNGKYFLINLPERVDNAKLPEVRIIDMTKERQKKFENFRTERKEEFKKDAALARLSKRKPEFNSISEILKNKIQDRLTKKEGIILLQNRRGFSSFIECVDCGYVETCDNCQVSLTYHITKKHLRCHYCGFVKSAPDICPDCSSIEIGYRGYGTQRVEEDLQKFFPDASILRMDLDTTTEKGSHDKILKKFSSGEIDILLGTQMVAKGLDFSHVTLVGVISADTQMLLPDFRSAERTFQLLTQVAGRAGRGGLLNGEVIIQTFQPDHYALQHVLTHDYLSFYSEEIKTRKELSYPPFSRIALIEIKGVNENEVSKHAFKFYELLKEKKSSLVLLGPCEAAIPKLKNQYRWHILIKDLKSNDPSGKIIRNILTTTMENYLRSNIGKSRNVKVLIDIDPVGML